MSGPTDVVLLRVDTGRQRDTHRLTRVPSSHFRFEDVTWKANLEGNLQQILRGTPRPSEASCPPLPLPPARSRDRAQAIRTPGRARVDVLARRAPRRRKVRIIESNEDVLLYDVGHIPRGSESRLAPDLNDPVVRDYVSREQFEALLRAKGIDQSTTVGVYGDKNNGGRRTRSGSFNSSEFTNAKVLDGGRPSGRRKASNDDRCPALSRHAVRRAPTVRWRIRAFMDDCAPSHAGEATTRRRRSPDEFTGKKLHMPDTAEGALRGGHIRAQRAFLGARGQSDGTFKVGR